MVAALWVVTEGEEEEGILEQLGALRELGVGAILLFLDQGKGAVDEARLARREQEIRGRIEAEGVGLVVAAARGNARQGPLDEGTKAALEALGDALIERVPAPLHPMELPALLVISERGRAVPGRLMLQGRLLRGRLRLRQDVALVGAQGEEVTRIERISSFGHKIDEARAGDLVELVLMARPELAPEAHFLSIPGTTVAQRGARVWLVGVGGEKPLVIFPEVAVRCRSHEREVSARITEAKAWQSLGEGEGMAVELAFDEPLVLEKGSPIELLDHGRTVARGMIPNGAASRLRPTS